MSLRKKGLFFKQKGIKCKCCCGWMVLQASWLIHFWIAFNLRPFWFAGTQYECHYRHQCCEKIGLFPKRPMRGSTNLYRADLHEYWSYRQTKDTVGKLVKCRIKYIPWTAQEAIFWPRYARLSDFTLKIPKIHPKMNIVKIAYLSFPLECTSI